MYVLYTNSHILLNVFFTFLCTLRGFPLHSIPESGRGYSRHSVTKDPAQPYSGGCLPAVDLWESSIGMAMVLGNPGKSSNKDKK